MDQPQYTTLLDALVAVPDPRHARGQRYGWRILLLIIAAGLASGAQTPHAIAHWAHLHHATFQTCFPELKRMPSESTILRALRQIDVAHLETHIAHFSAQLPQAETGQIVTVHGEVIQGYALDGKAVRGANAHGSRTHLVSLVQHENGTTIAQVAVAQKRNEITASHRLLRGRDLSGTLITMDALLAQRALARQIREQGGHYLMVIKQHHVQMRDEIARFFDLPDHPADGLQRDGYTSLTKGHGRIETRRLDRYPDVCAVWKWPDSAQVLRRTSERLVVKTGKQSREVTYGITSLALTEVAAAQMEARWRNHWTIENRKHYVRDVTFGEDRNQLHTGHAPHVLAALRNGLIDLWRSHGWTNMAEAVRTHAASLHRTLACIGAIPNPTLT